MSQVIKRAKGFLRRKKCQLDLFDEVKKQEYRKNLGKGWRCGELHHRAKLTDHDCELVIELYEIYKLTYVQIAEKFEVSAMTICRIVTGRQRSRKAGRVKHG